MGDGGAGDRSARPSAPATGAGRAGAADPGRRRPRRPSPRRRRSRPPPRRAARRLLRRRPQPAKAHPQKAAPQPTPAAKRQAAPAPSADWTDLDRLPQPSIGKRRRTPVLRRQRGRRARARRCRRGTATARGERPSRSADLPALCRRAASGCGTRTATSPGGSDVTIKVTFKLDAERPPRSARRRRRRRRRATPAPGRRRRDRAVRAVYAGASRSPSCRRALYGQTYHRELQRQKRLCAKPMRPTDARSSAAWPLRRRSARCAASRRRPALRRRHRRREPGRAAAACRSPSRPSAAPQVGARSPRWSTSDLERSGLFRPLDPGDLPRAVPGRERPAAVRRSGSRSAPRRCSTGRSRSTPTGACTSTSGSGTSTPSEPAARHSSSPRRRTTGGAIAHKIADAVYEKLTGEKGYFDTRVVFVAESGPKTKRVTPAGDHGPGRRQSELPRPTARTMVFTPALLHQAPGDHLHGAARRPARRSTCSTSRPAARRCSASFTGHDVRAALLARRQQGRASSVEKDGNIDIYVMDLRNRATRAADRPTSAIDTSPSFSPDGAPDRVQLRPRRLARSST